MRRLLLPGSTRSDPVLQRDAAVIVYTNMRIVAEKTCDPKNFLILDTRFVAFDPAPIPDAKAGPNARAWSEVWFATACGREITANVTFTPGPTGTSIKVGLDTNR
jgi:hypothetical protein